MEIGPGSELAPCSQLDQPHVGFLLVHGVGQDMVGHVRQPCLAPRRGPAVLVTRDATSVLLVAPDLLGHGVPTSAVAVDSAKAAASSP